MRFQLNKESTLSVIVIVTRELKPENIFRMSLKYFIHFVET